MKKVTARRQGALDRFSIRPFSGGDRVLYDAYFARKSRELASLKKSLGIHTAE